MISCLFDCEIFIENKNNILFLNMFPRVNCQELDFRPELTSPSVRGHCHFILQARLGKKIASHDRLSLLIIEKERQEMEGT